MKKKIKYLSLFLSIVVVGVIGYYGFSIIKFSQNINSDPNKSNLADIADNNQIEDNPPEWEGNERVNILILGIDSRGIQNGDAPRSDTMMVVSIDPLTKQANLFSILRDTYTNIPNYSSNRINTAYALGGSNLAMKTVSEFLNIPIQYYINIDFEGFIALVDAIGGVEFEVEKNMRYTDPTEPEYNINLKAGLQQLDGSKALQYVRFRQDRLSDFTRTERQRNFLKAVSSKMQSSYSILRLPNTLNKIEPYIETNLTLRNMWSLASLAYSIDSDQLDSAQIPPDALLREEMINGAAVITVKENKLQEYVQEQFQLKPTAVNEVSTQNQQ